VFNWLDLININVLIIIVLMVAVAGMNMIATLLIIILDNTRLVGVLKALGAADGQVRRLFLHVALYVIGAGVVLGNAVAFGLAWLQRTTGWIRLPQESYYVSLVPVDYSVGKVLLLNAGIMAACGVLMLLPVLVVARIRPVQVLRFD
jgi:lipoprotein-releasing system permease protein